MQNNILIVEDNRVNLELITLFIEQYAQDNDSALKVLTARNGEEAIKACEQNPIDIVFMDLMMPAMNGIEATKLIKAKYPQTMIIIISAFGDEDRQKEMLNNGAEDYITKPVDATLFKNQLHHYLERLHAQEDN